MMKKLLMSMLCLFGFMNMASAEEISVLADLNAVTTEGSAVYDSNTHQVTFNAQYSCAIRVGANEFSGISAAEATTLTIKSSEAVGGYRLDVYFTDGSSIIGNEGAGTKFTGDATDQLEQVYDLTAILSGNTTKKLAYFRINTPGDAGADNLKTRTFTEIELKYNKTSVILCKEGGEVVPTVAPWYTRADAESDYLLTPYNAEYNVGTSTAAYYGVMWNGENLNNYADLSGYKAIRVYQASKDNLPRAFFINADATNHVSVLGFEWNEENSYYELDLAKAMAAVGNCKLTTLRATSTSTCKGVYLVEKVKSIDYILSGAGELSPAAQAALNDASARVFDAKGLTNTTPIALNTANPNAIIIANDGQVSNDHNVLVDGMINKLQLTDGYPLVLPREASYASAGSYTRTVTAAYSTACLPLCFEFTGEGVYMYESMEGDVINFREVEDMRGLKGSYPFLLKGAGEITMADGGQIYHEWDYADYVFTGTYAGKTLTSDANKTYYGVKDGAIVKVGENVTVAPFRAYFQLDATSEAKSLKMNLGEETAINSVVEGLNSARAFYNAAGVRQNGLQKGLNIVEMSNGATRKIMIK